MVKKTNIAGISKKISDKVDKDSFKKTQIPKEQRLFADLNIGISISENPDLRKLGYGPMHLQDATVEISRYLLIHGTTLIYGGDLRSGGYTYLFSELAKQYGSKENYDKDRFVNYFAWPIHKKLTKGDELDFKQQRVGIVKLPPPKGVNESKALPDPSSKEMKLIMAKSFSLMRKEINANCDVRILLGGKTNGFQGIYPGIPEEAYLAMLANKPVYLLGAYGGATQEVINLITKQSSGSLNKKEQLNDQAYADLFASWNKDQKQKINLDDFYSFFKKYSLKKFSKNNGLSEEENLRLFSTDNLTEMMFYILKGLIRSFNKKGN
jgi:SLOG cluster2